MGWPRPGAQRRSLAACRQWRSRLGNGLHHGDNARPNRGWERGPRSNNQDEAELARIGPQWIRLELKQWPLRRRAGWPFAKMACFSSVFETLRPQYRLAEPLSLRPAQIVVDFNKVSLARHSVVALASGCVTTPLYATGPCEVSMTRCRATTERSLEPRPSFSHPSEGTRTLTSDPSRGGGIRRPSQPGRRTSSPPGMFKCARVPG